MQKQKKFLPVLFALLLTSSLVGDIFISADKASAARAITFPVIGKASFRDDYNAPRDGGARTHHAIDIIAKKGAPLVSVINGTITDVQYPQPSWGYSVTVRDSSGYSYSYLHMNDDKPGTNDGKGGPMNAYAPYVKEGNRVTKGQLIGRVGDSGNANGISHLHFEMRNPSNERINPHTSLVRAKRISKPVIPPAYANELLPYGTTFKGGVNVAMGNFDGDPASELITGMGKGGAPHVKVYDTTNARIASFYAYDPAFKGGVDVAAGDVDGDGTNEIITGAGPGGGPHVKVFDTDGSAIGGFFAYDSKGRTGIKVTAGDVDGDGTDEIITSLQAGKGPLIKIFKLTGGTGVLINSFEAYTSAFRGGVDVAAGDVVGSTDEEVVTSPLSAGGPHVKVFDLNGATLGSFFAYDSKSRNGVRVSVGNIEVSSPKSEILTMPASLASPIMKMFDVNGAVLSSRSYLERWWTGFYDVAAGHDTSRFGTGTNRRVSIQVGTE